jgi:hypothetical protein
MLDTEKVFDMLPVVVELYDKLDIDGYRKKIAKENKGKKDVPNEEIGIDLFMYILKNSAKIKEEIFEVVAIFEDKTVEEIKAQSFVVTINAIKEIFQDEQTVGFLTQAME